MTSAPSRDGCPWRRETPTGSKSDFRLPSPSRKALVLKFPNVSCTKKTNTPGVLMHVFPRNDLLRRRWTAFVRDTQTRFQADEGKTSELCWDSLRAGLLHQAQFGSSASSFIRIWSPGEVDIWRKDRCHYRCWNLLNHVGHPSRMAIEVGASWEIRPTTDSLYFVLPHELHYLVF